MVCTQLLLFEPEIPRLLRQHRPKIGRNQLYCLMVEVGPILRHVGPIVSALALCSIEILRPFSVVLCAVSRRRRNCVDNLLARIVVSKWNDRVWFSEMRRWFIERRHPDPMTLLWAFLPSIMNEVEVASENFSVVPLPFRRINYRRMSKFSANDHAKQSSVSWAPILSVSYSGIECVDASSDVTSCGIPFHIWQIQMFLFTHDRHLIRIDED